MTQQLSEDKIKHQCQLRNSRARYESDF